LALTLGNQKAIAFFVALLATAVNLHILKLAGYLQLSAASYELILTITLTYAALAARMHLFLTSLTARRRINKPTAVIMAGAAVGVAASSRGRRGHRSSMCFVVLPASLAQDPAAPDSRQSLGDPNATNIKP